VDSKLSVAIPICFKLLLPEILAAVSLTFCTAGRSSPINIAMIAMTTRSSISVKPLVTRMLKNSPIEAQNPITIMYSNFAFIRSIWT
jgi:hypothetical protein